MWSLGRSVARCMSTEPTGKLVLIGTGKDRLGIVKDVSQIIYNEGGSFMNSTMKRLAGTFAMMVQVEIPLSRMETFKQAIAEADSNFAFHLTAHQAYDVEEQLSKYYSADLVVIGADHNGILHQITKYLASYGVSIEEVNSHTTPAPFGGSLFNLNAKVQVPDIVKLEDLNQKLDEVEQELAVDIQVYERENEE